MSLDKWIKLSDQKWLEWEITSSMYVVWENKELEEINDKYRLMAELVTKNMSNELYTNSHEESQSLSEWEEINPDLMLSEMNVRVWDIIKLGLTIPWYQKSERWWKFWVWWWKSITVYPKEVIHIQAHWDLEDLKEELNLNNANQNIIRWAMGTTLNIKKDL